MERFVVARLHAEHVKQVAAENLAVGTIDQSRLVALRQLLGQQFHGLHRLPVVFLRKHLLGRVGKGISVNSAQHALIDRRQHSVSAVLGSFQAVFHAVELCVDRVGRNLRLHGGASQLRLQQVAVAALTLRLFRNHIEGLQLRLRKVLCLSVAHLFP